jgi:hypothetical protein
MPRGTALCRLQLRRWQRGMLLLQTVGGAMTQLNDGGAACTRNMVTMWAMEMAMRLAGGKEGKGKDGKGNVDGNVRVVGNKEDEGSKAMALATRMVGEWTVMATKRAICNGNEGG